MTGKAIRMERIMDRNSGRTVIVPMDHGVTIGPVEGLTDMRLSVSKMARGGANAIVMHKGMPRSSHRGYGRDVGLVIHLSAGTSLSPDPNAKELVCTVEEAIRIGADAVSIHVNLGADTESVMLRQLGMISSKCDHWQMPLLVMIYTRGRNIKNSCDVNYVKHSARVAAELGADIVKVPYTGSMESFAEVVQGCPIPVVIAGGPKINTDRDVLEMVSDAISAGAAGVSIGRNAFQHEKPSTVVKAIGTIVHENATVEEALEMLQKKQPVAAC